MLNAIKKPNIILITGPTAVGKTKFSIDLGMQLGGPQNVAIIGLDSMQIYDRLCITNAKPSLSELHTIPHHLINAQNSFDPMNVRRYLKETISLINHLITQENKTVIVVGGSFMYAEQLILDTFCSRDIEQQIIQHDHNDDKYHDDHIPIHPALQNNVIFNPLSCTTIRQYMDDYLQPLLSQLSSDDLNKNSAVEFLNKTMFQIDQIYQLKFKNNKRKIIRGIQLFLQHHEKPTILQSQRNNDPDFSNKTTAPTLNLRYKTCVISLTSDIQSISSRCLIRCCEMLKLQNASTLSDVFKKHVNKNQDIRNNKNDNNDDDQTFFKNHFPDHDPILLQQFTSNNILNEVYCIYNDLVYLQHSQQQQHPHTIDTSIGIMQSIGAKELLHWFYWLYNSGYIYVPCDCEQNYDGNNHDEQSLKQDQQNVDLYKSCPDVYGFTSLCSKLHHSSHRTGICDKYSNHLRWLKIFQNPYAKLIQEEVPTQTTVQNSYNQNIIWSFLHDYNLLPCSHTPLHHNLSNNSSSNDKKNLQLNLNKNSSFLHTNPSSIEIMDDQINAQSLETKNINIYLYNIRTILPAQNPFLPLFSGKLFNQPQNPHQQPLYFNQSCDCIECEFIKELHLIYPPLKQQNIAHPLYNITLLSQCIILLATNTISLAKSQQKWIFNRLSTLSTLHHNQLTLQQEIPAVKTTRDKINQHSHDLVIYNADTTFINVTHQHFCYNTVQGQTVPSTTQSQSLPVDILIPANILANIKQSIDQHAKQSRKQQKQQLEAEVMNYAADFHQQQKNDHNTAVNKNELSHICPGDENEIVGEKSPQDLLKLCALCHGFQNNSHEVIESLTWKDSVVLPLTNCVKHFFELHSNAPSDDERFGPIDNTAGICADHDIGYMTSQKKQKTNYPNLSQCNQPNPYLSLPQQYPCICPRLLHVAEPVNTSYSDKIHNSNPGNSPIHCDICDIVVVGEKNYKVHCKGKQHKHHLKKSKLLQQ